ncbi:hypothetical protein [Desulfovibrio sp. Huiquan2017]|uniref:hypothetical protein n=1 Tax=Desulfovibrio sp. Huiquan2017 TaxID=2816861 RepID=UPI001A922F30|nr:hypothetical protein [Desulfovibrio sp. Huiquan2017]
MFSVLPPSPFLNRHGKITLWGVHSLFNFNLKSKTMIEESGQKQSDIKEIGGVIFQLQEGMYVAGGTEDAECVIYGDTSPEGQAGLELFKLWCGENNVYYYGWPHEKFLESEAIEQAQIGGYSDLFWEDLS